MISVAYKWFVASRPWTYTASIMPIVLGSVLPYVEPQQDVFFNTFKLGLFFLSLIGGVSLQAAANFFNTYGDYVSGVDSIESAFSCPQLVTQAMKPESIRSAGIFMCILACFVGIILSFLCGWLVFFFGVIGLIAVVFYTVGWFPYKYIGLGVPVVFFFMGPFIVVPSYYIQSGVFSWSPFLISMPISFLVAAIMHANDLRDITYDRASGIYTIAALIGLKYSIVVYAIFCLSAFLSVFLLVLFQYISVYALTSWVLVPFLWVKIQTLRQSINHNDIQKLVVWTASFHLWFCLFFIVGIGAHFIV